VVNGDLESIREMIAEKAKSVSETACLKPKKLLGHERRDILLGTLKYRFEMNRRFRESVKWAKVEKALRAHPSKLWSLHKLEFTGGEPDIIGVEKGEFVFGDCSEESPIGRRNVVFDRAAEEYARKHDPKKEISGNAIDMAANYGAELMSTEQYFALCEMLMIDEDSWSWLETPADSRKLGEASHGGCFDEIYVIEKQACSHDDRGGFRAVVRIPKAK
jgi:hypothetical protein